MPGASAAWSSGSGAARQEYYYSKSQFGGTLSDLASQVTISALTQHHGAKFQGSAPFAPCPGAAGVGTFLLSNEHATLQEGFSVQSGHAVRIIYLRPIGTPVDPNVAQAMQNALCSVAL
jgi:hypothetical protein